MSPARCAAAADCSIASRNACSMAGGISSDVVVVVVVALASGVCSDGVCAAGSVSIGVFLAAAGVVVVPPPAASNAACNSSSSICIFSFARASERSLATRAAERLLSSFCAGAR